MKILLTGGGSGGHFFPLIAVADSIYDIAKEKKLADVEIYYMADRPYNEGLLFDKRITFLKTSAGKMRRYFSILNIIDLFKTAYGLFKTLIQVYNLYPDVIFSKGGYVSFPAVFASKILRIPLIIHETDSVPGRLNLWASKFAERVAISYPEASSYFPKEKIAYTGNPVRQDISKAIQNGAFEYLDLDPAVPVVLVLGGSQGSAMINDVVVDALPALLEKFQVIHQAGPKNLEYVKQTSSVVLRENKFKGRYKVFDFLNELALRMSAGAATIVVSRAGGTIFEIAEWGLPSIIIPITDSNGDHQRKNAFSYAHTGACEVIEESNLAPNILVSEIERITSSPETLAKMRQSAKKFAHPLAARTIAEELVRIALKHEV